MAAALSQRGYPPLTDDICAISIDPQGVMTALFTSDSDDKQAAAGLTLREITENRLGTVYRRLEAAAL